jgi:hypothetical protein
VIEHDRVELHPVLCPEGRDRRLVVGGEDRAPTATRGKRRHQPPLGGLVVDQQ